MLGKWTNNNKIEILFLTVFSAVIIALFYLLISMNGLVLGNDPAVHLAKAEVFLQTGQIPLDNIGWIPPLFEIMLAIIISLTGASNVLQMVFLIKVLAIIVDWLLFISVYLVSSKFFNKKIGAVAAVFLALCFPLYELNTWGGYTTALGLAFMVLLLYYAYLATKQSAGIAVTFFVAFSLILSHQLTAFVAVIIMLPIMLYLLIKSRGAFLKGFVVIIVGGSIAFFAFYFPAIIGHLDMIIYHVFFGNQAYSVQIPYTSAESFLLYYGFIQFFAVGGIAVSYSMLKRKKQKILFATLLLSLLVPFFFAESYLFGFLLPFEWFTYYLTPPIAILGAVFAVFAAEKLLAQNLQVKWKRAAGFGLALAMFGLIVFPVYNVYGRVAYAGEYNETSNLLAYDAAVWLNQNYPQPATVVVTRNPGEWFSFFSNKTIIAQTYDWEGATVAADTIIGLNYEMQGSASLVKACELKDSFVENYVYLDQLWSRTAYSSPKQDYISFNQDGTNYRYAIANFSRTISFDNPADPKTMEINYFNDQVALKRTILLQNSGYSTNNTWSITPLTGTISNVTLHLTTYFDLQFHFDKAQIPKLMDWTNPWDMPQKFSSGDQWASVDFSSSDLSQHYIGVYDGQEKVAFGFYFTDLPDKGNIGAMGSRQIDAVRYEYNFDSLSANQTVVRQYQVLTVSQSSKSDLQQDDLKGLFDAKTSQTVKFHCYKDYIAKNNVNFIVYDKNQIAPRDSLPLSSTFLPQASQAKFLELSYSNSRYVVFKILDNYNQTQIWK